MLSNTSSSSDFRAGASQANRSFSMRMTRDGNQPQTHTIVSKDVDVFLGRGRGSYERKGNQAFMRIISSYVATYTAATKNKDKIRITDEIVSLIKDAGGRFLGIEKSSNGGRAETLYEVSHTEARMKVSQALRHRRCLDNREKNKAKAKSSPPSRRKEQQHPEKDKSKPSIIKSPIELNQEPPWSFCNNSVVSGNDSKKSSVVSTNSTENRIYADLDAADDISEFSFLEPVCDDSLCFQQLLQRDPLSWLNHQNDAKPARPCYTHTGNGRGANKKDLKSMIAARKRQRQLLHED
ncbi:hypothetical protein ACA910_018339 [Epithemia clementina (nom. ined.)]